LGRLHALLLRPITRLDLSWVANMGAAAIPTCVREAGDETLSADARNFILLVLGSTLSKAHFEDHPDAKNDFVLPVIVKSLGDPDPYVRRSAAFAARFIDDPRLVPVLRPLLNDTPAVQEQAMIALGTSGHESEVMPIARLFFESDDSIFRYSCLYTLATLCLRRGIDVAAVLDQNMGSFGAKNLANVDSVRERFVDFQMMAALLKKLSSADVSERREANEKLRALTGKEVEFDPEGDDAERQCGIEEWRAYFLKDYWLVPPPPKP